MLLTLLKFWYIFTNLINGCDGLKRFKVLYRIEVDYIYLIVFILSKTGHWLLFKDVLSNLRKWQALIEFVKKNMHLIYKHVCDKKGRW